MNTSILNRMRKVYARKGSTKILSGKFIMVLSKEDFGKLSLECAAAYFKLIRLGWLEHQKRIRIMTIKRFNSFIPKDIGLKFSEGTSTYLRNEVS